MGLFDMFKKTTKESLLKHLQSRISDKSSLEDIVAVFEKMCSIPFKEDAVLFETGTYSFTGEPMFYFSLARQFPNKEEEYYQLHVDVLYSAEEGNKDFGQSTWNEDIDKNIFEYIRESHEYVFCKDKKHCKVEIYLDET